MLARSTKLFMFVGDVVVEPHTSVTQLVSVALVAHSLIALFFIRFVIALKTVSPWLFTSLMREIDTCWRVETISVEKSAGRAIETIPITTTTSTRVMPR
jgi:hypothetical protein